MEEIEKYSDKWFLSLYLMYGSVEEVFRSYPDTLPISTANYHRLIKRYGLVKSAGRHVSLSETLHFFRLKAMKPGMPLEVLYKSMPRSFQTSLSTLHRICHFMERNIVRRKATALLLIKDNNKNEILVGNEVFENLRYGKKNSGTSIPIGFSKKDELNFDSILRVLQQEVYTQLAISAKLGKNANLAKKIIPKNLQPIFYFDIVDVRVSVFLINIPPNMVEFSSYKLVNHRFESLGAIINGENIRTGVGEIVKIYEDYLSIQHTVKFPIQHVSFLNSKAVVPNLKLALRYLK